MTENVYEGMFILDSNRYGRDPGGVSGQIPELIQQHGGKVLASRLWEERRLAYPIGSHRKGTYWLTYFKLGTDQMSDAAAADSVERECRPLADAESRSADRRRPGDPRLDRHRPGGRGPSSGQGGRRSAAVPETDVPIIDALGDVKDLPEE